MKDRQEVIEKWEGRGIQGGQEIICNPEVAVRPVMDGHGNPRLVCTGAHWRVGIGCRLPCSRTLVVTVKGGYRE